MTKKETKYDNGEVVYFRLDQDNTPYLIISITFTLCGGYYYTLSNGVSQPAAYEREISNNMFDANELIND